MKPGRGLTLGEWSSLSAGLASALRDAGARPIVVAAAHPGARLATLWRGKTPILTRGGEIWWPKAGPDLSLPSLEPDMAVLQHELQHVLEYAQNRLSAANYLTGPHNWTYDYVITPKSVWADFGAEQRASIVEALWWLERGGNEADIAEHRRLIPWA